MDLPATGIRILVDVALQFRLPGGNGATIGLFELDPWSASDISSFQTCYGTNVPITSVNVDGGAGTGPGESEAALDIETAITLAPQVKLYVYDAPVTSVLDLDR